MIRKYKLKKSHIGQFDTYLTDPIYIYIYSIRLDESKAHTAKVHILVC